LGLACPCICGQSVVVANLWISGVGRKAMLPFCGIILLFKLNIMTRSSPAGSRKKRFQKKYHEKGNIAMSHPNFYMILWATKFVWLN
jgi:hypothetical protein